MRYLFVLLVLGGCATPQEQSDPKWDAFESRMAPVQQQMQNGEITRRELALTALQTMRDVGLDDPGLQEVWTYRVFLAGKVDRGEMTEDEARYLDTKMVNEVADRFEAAQRSRKQRPVINYPRAVRCKPDGYGGAVCR